MVRMLLAPAMMVMLSEGNWRLPVWLDCRLPNVEFSH